MNRTEHAYIKSHPLLQRIVDLNFTVIENTFLADLSYHTIKEVSDHYGYYTRVILIDSGSALHRLTLARELNESNNHKARRPR